MAVANIASAKEIIAVTEKLGNMQFVNESGEVDGFATHVVKALAQRAGYDLNILMLPWARAYKLVQEQENTLIFSIGHTPEREARFKWVGTFCRLPNFVWGTTQQAVSDITEFEDLKNYSFVVTKGSKLEEYLRQNAFTRITTVTRQEQVLGMMLKGRADFTITNDHLMETKIARQNLDPGLFRKIFKLSDLDNRFSVAFGPKTSPTLHALFQNAFVELQEENVIAQLSNDWGLSCR